MSSSDSSSSSSFFSSFLSSAAAESPPPAAGAADANADGSAKYALTCKGAHCYQLNNTNKTEITMSQELKHTLLSRPYQLQLTIDTLGILLMPAQG